MSEYIITSEQLKTATEAYLKRELSRPITDVFISGDKLPEIVRCRDCKYLNDANSCPCGWYALEDLNGFCKWGERRQA